MARLPAAQENTGIAAMFVPATGYFLALNTADPVTTGTAEVTGGSYARQAIAFGTASAGSEASTSAQNFTGMPSTTVDWFSLWSLVSAGTYLGGGQLGSSLTVPAAATVAFAIGAVTVALS